MYYSVLSYSMFLHKKVSNWYFYNFMCN